MPSTETSNIRQSLRKKKFYAVIDPKPCGIYLDWSLCQNHVNGFSRALYKSFKSLKEACKFILNDPRSNIASINEVLIFTAAQSSVSFVEYCKDHNIVLPSDMIPLSDKVINQPIDGINNQSLNEIASVSLSSSESHYLMSPESPILNEEIETIPKSMMFSDEETPIQTIPKSVLSPVHEIPDISVPISNNISVTQTIQKSLLPLFSPVPKEDAVIQKSSCSCMEIVDAMLNSLRLVMKELEEERSRVRALEVKMTALETRTKVGTKSVVSPAEACSKLAAAISFMPAVNQISPPSLPMEMSLPIDVVKRVVSHPTPSTNSIPKNVVPDAPTVQRSPLIGAVTTPNLSNPASIQGFGRYRSYSEVTLASPKPKSKPICEAVKPAIQEGADLMILGDSIVGRINCEKMCPGKTTNLVPIPGGKISQGSQYIQNIPTKTSSDIILHFGTNNLIPDSVEQILGDYKELIIAAKSKFRNVMVSSITPRLHFKLDWFLNFINHSLEDLCVELGVFFIANDTTFKNSGGHIMNEFIYKDNLHLSRNGTAKLAMNFRNFLCANIGYVISQNLYNFFRVKGNLTNY